MTRTNGGVEFQTPQGIAKFDGKEAMAAVDMAESLNAVGADFLISSIGEIARAGQIEIRDGAFTGRKERKILSYLADLFGMRNFDRKETDVTAMRDKFVQAATSDGGNLDGKARKAGILEDTGSLDRKVLDDYLKASRIQARTA